MKKNITKRGIAILSNRSSEHILEIQEGMIMKNKLYSKLKIQIIGVFIATIFLLSFMILPQAFSHGGKTHEENEFTAFSALNGATKLYGQLLGKSKLDETWEMELVNVSISTRQNQGNKEFVVSFEKLNGDPKKVFIFLDVDGKYTGSNFSGE